MSRTFTVSLEFKAVGDGIKDIETALAKLRQGAKAVEGAAPSLDRLSQSAARVSGNINGLLGQVGLLSGGMGRGVSAVAALTNGFNQLAAAAQAARVAQAVSAVNSGGAVSAAAQGALGLAGNAPQGLAAAAQAAAALGKSAEASAPEVEILSSGLTGIGAAAGPAGLAVLAVAANFAIFAKAIGIAGDALVAFGGFAKQAIEASEKLRSATLGLESVAKFNGIDPAAAIESVKNLDLVRGGLISVGEASKALQNLLAAGFSLDQSITLIERLGDKAAFSRQQGLDFGEAIVKTTAGIKQGNSILADGAGVTENLGTMLKRAGLQASQLSEITDNAAVRQAIFAGFVRGTADALGNAGKFADSYTGQLAKLSAGSTKVDEKFGDLFKANVGLSEVLNLGSKALDLINQNFETYTKALSLFAPVLSGVTALITPFVGGLFSISGAVGLALQGIATLRTLNGIGDPGKNAALAQLGKDLSDFSSQAALAIAKLPSEITKFKAAVKDASAGSGKPLDVFSVDIVDVALPGMGKLLSLSEQLTAESDKRAAIEAASDQRRIDAFEQTIELERKRQALSTATGITVAGIGQNPLIAEFQQQQAKVQSDADERLREELERLSKERTDLLKAINTEQAKAKPDLFNLKSLRGDLGALDEAVISFQAVNEAMQDAEQTALKVDFAKRFADQLLTINKEFFDLRSQLLPGGENPFVSLYRDASQAVFDFGQAFGENTKQFQDFADLQQQVLDRQIAIVKAQEQLKNFEFGQQAQAFAQKAGVSLPGSGRSVTDQIFDQFHDLLVQGGDSARIANKFLTDAANANRLDVSGLNFGQKQEVLQAFADLPADLAAQQRAAQELAKKEADERKRIHDEMVKALGFVQTSLDANTIQNGLLTKAITDGAIIEVTADGGATIKSVTASNKGSS